MKKIIYIISVILVSFTLVSCVKDDDDKTKNYIVKGDKIPEFGPLDGSEGTISSGDFTGKRGLIVFFASYCPDCHALMPAIQEVWDELGEAPDYLIAPISRVSGYETVEKLEDWWSAPKQSFTMPYFLDIDQIAYNKFGNRGIPRVYLTDTQGKVVKMWVEVSDLKAEYLIDELKKLK